MNFLANHIEALIFSSPSPVDEKEIRSCLTEMFEAEIPETDISEALESLQEKYRNEAYPFEVIKSGGGFQFLTKPAYQSSISILLKQQSKKRLSTAAMETLAIIAYKQPVSRAQVEQIRGVGSDYSIQKLLDKELIEIKGKADTVGRPLLYGTSEKFMDYFGINSIGELPTPKDFEADDNKIGTEAE